MPDRHRSKKRIKCFFYNQLLNILMKMSFSPMIDPHVLYGYTKNNFVIYHNRGDMAHHGPLMFFYDNYDYTSPSCPFTYNYIYL